MNLRSLLDEPRVPDPPPPRWADWALVVVLVIAGVIEVQLRTDLVWPVASLVIVAVALLGLPLRRRHPLGALAYTLSITTTCGIVWRISAGRPLELYITIAILLLPYALLRWGSGRSAVAGLGLMLLAWLVGVTLDPTTPGEAVGSFLFFFFPAELGAVVRYRTESRRRELDEVRLRERAQIARELHDTVAHHVSAIAVQAQAGRAVADLRPDAASESLAVIEEAASRTLAELRGMVGTLRRDPDGPAEGAAMRPQRGVADIADLAAVAPDHVRVQVHVDEDATTLRPAVDAAIYRLAQESITNAVRHARDATLVDVRVTAEATGVRLRVHDDGRSSVAGSRPAGFGLVGMRERAELLGGTLEAGPDPAGGWTVLAALPRESDPR